MQLCECWRLGWQSTKEGIDVVGRALDLDGDAGLRVQDAAGKMEALCEAIDVGGEADSLNDAADFASDCMRAGC